MRIIQCDEPEPVFDFDSPEDVLFEISDYGHKHVSETFVLCSEEGVVGAASYEEQYGGFLNYTIESMVDLSANPGWYVIENVTGFYAKGDGWEADDDIEFYCGDIRPATTEEISSFFGCDFWSAE